MKIRWGKNSSEIYMVIEPETEAENCQMGLIESGLKNIGADYWKDECHFDFEPRITLSVVMKPGAKRP